MSKQENIKNYVLNNPHTVAMTATSMPGVFVLKYKKRVFWDNLWNEVLEECRGTLVDKDFNVLARPFTKIYNQFENNTNIALDEEVTAFRKINGFMAAISVINGELVVSTTGSIDSDFAKLAKQRVMELDPLALFNIEDNLAAQAGHPGFTMIVEICDPSDPHIIPEEAGIYLLGIRKNSWEASQNLMVKLDWNEEEYNEMCELYGMKACDMYKCKFSEVVKMAKEAQHEGYVVYGKYVNLKIKSPYYKIKKFLARKNPDKLAVMLDDPQQIKQTVDEEFYPLIDYLAANKGHYAVLDEQGRLDYIRNFLNAM